MSTYGLHGLFYKGVGGLRLAAAAQPYVEGEGEEGKREVGGGGGTLIAFAPIFLV